MDFYIKESLEFGTWGRDIHILALSILLKRKVYVFELISKIKPYLERGRIISGVESNEKPLILHFQRNHFDLVVPENLNVNVPVPRLNIYEPLNKVES